MWHHSFNLEFTDCKFELTCPNEKERDIWLHAFQLLSKMADNKVSAILVNPYAYEQKCLLEENLIENDKEQHTELHQAVQLGSSKSQYLKDQNFRASKYKSVRISEDNRDSDQTTQNDNLKGHILSQIKKQSEMLSDASPNITIQNINI